MNSTTLSIEKSIHRKASRKAKMQRLSVSAVARMLLEAYSNNKINIVAIAFEEPIQLRELQDNEITPGLRKSANRAYRMKMENLINL